VSEDTRDRFVKTLKALANTTRLTILASLAVKPKHAYALAKELKLSYPLTHLHLKGLRKMGLVEEIKAEGLPSTKTYAPTNFEIVLTAENIRQIFSEGDES
jgi:ArsR family transcriptional regulator